MKFPQLVQPRRPTADLIVRLDVETHEYLHYKEFTPGTLVLAPSEFMNRRMGDILPELAALYAPAIHAAASERQMQLLSYSLRGRARIVRVAVVGQNAFVNIANTNTVPGIACRG